MNSDLCTLWSIYFPAADTSAAPQTRPLLQSSYDKSELIGNNYQQYTIRTKLEWNREFITPLEAFPNVSLIP